MQNEDAESVSGLWETSSVADEPIPEVETPPLKTAQSTQARSLAEDQSDDSSEESNVQSVDGQRQASDNQNPVSQYVDRSQVGILGVMTGAHSNAYYTSFNYSQGTTSESQQSLDVFVRFAELESPCRIYKSLDTLNVIGYSGSLQAGRILLLSCYDEDIALHVAQSIAHEINIAGKELITIDSIDDGRYNFRNLIDSLARPKEKFKLSPDKPGTICVWDAAGIGDDEIASGILDSLMSRNSRIQQYKSWLIERSLCLICLISPQRIEQYDDSGPASLRSLKIDFLSPLLEHYELEDYENLAETIRQQRQAGRWSENDADFYKEIRNHLRIGDLSSAIRKRMAPDIPDAATVEALFNRQDPLTDTVVYCATYFRDLSPQDFSYMVEFFLGETTEEVTRRVVWRQSRNENDVTDVVEAVPLVNRWRREPDAILRRFKLAPKSENGRRIIDFQEDGLRQRLNQYIRNENYFFFESNFVFVRQQGLFFSPKKGIAEAARQLLVEVATQYASNEVAGWLYEVVQEFEDMAQGASLLKQLTPRFQFLPDLSVKTARRYVAHGLSRILIRLDKESELREAVRLFWQKLLQSQHQWFLDLLRRMGDSAPAETLKWLKQLIDQGSDLIRRQGHSYVFSYLLHRDTFIYPTLKELILWSKSHRARRVANEVLIAYCVETNRRLAQHEYGQWPSSHPLFGFQSRSEAEECLDLLVGWVCTAAVEIDADKALFIIADIFAGWYFILSSPSESDSSDVVSDTGLNAQVVRDLLFQRLAQHSPRSQRNALGAIWSHIKNNVVDRIIELDKFIDEIPSLSPNAELIADAATARRKLVETRAALGELRTTFITWTAETAPAEG
jgi:hypothetical protein